MQMKHISTILPHTGAWEKGVCVWGGEWCQQFRVPAGPMLERNISAIEMNKVQNRNIHCTGADAGTSDKVIPSSDRPQTPKMQSAFK